VYICADTGGIQLPEQSSTDDVRSAGQYGPPVRNKSSASVPQISRPILHCRAHHARQVMTEPWLRVRDVHHAVAKAVSSRGGRVGVVADTRSRF
jgi:hypothetical protein